MGQHYALGDVTRDGSIAPKEETAGGVCAGGSVGLWGFKARFCATWLLSDGSAGLLSFTEEPPVHANVTIVSDNHRLFIARRAICSVREPARFAQKRTERSELFSRQRGCKMALGQSWRAKRKRDRRYLK